MKTKDTRKAWTIQEIAYLKKCYAQGVPLKEMEKVLERSTASINKAMIRFKVREDREESLRDRREKGLGSCEVCVPKGVGRGAEEDGQNMQDVLSPGCRRYYQRRAHHPRHALVHEPTIFARRADIAPTERKRIAAVPGGRTRLQGLYWVDFSKVLEWLHYIRVRVFYAPEGPLGSSYCYEVVDQRLFIGEREYGYKTKAQIVLLANKLRLARDLPIFYVSDVTLYA